MLEALFATGQRGESGTIGVRLLDREPRSEVGQEDKGKGGSAE